MEEAAFWPLLHWAGSGEKLEKVDKKPNSCGRQSFLFGDIKPKSRRNLFQNFIVLSAI